MLHYALIFFLIAIVAAVLALAEFQWLLQELRRFCSSCSWWCSSSHWSWVSLVAPSGEPPERRSNEDRCPAVIPPGFLFLGSV